ncbi:hypothetical protein ACHAQH_002582 [Verticillium albo-atrum]
MAPQFSLRGLFSHAADFLAQIPVTSTPSPADVTPYRPLTSAPSCPIDGPTSCLSTPKDGASCCFVAPSGRMLLTQFWDQQVHAGGSERDWTVHGLWPDLCDGSYKAFCGMTPHFNNITEILVDQGHEDLVKQMNRYWVAAYGSNDHLWAHEYNKHASCINTLAPSCYASAYTPGAEVADYFTRAFGLFRTLDTYAVLAAADIVPSSIHKYSIKAIEGALEKHTGGKVVLRCSGRGGAVLHEAWYAFFVKGSLQTGNFVPAETYGEHGDARNCGEEVWYLPKVCRLPGGCAGDGEL